MKNFPLLKFDLFHEKFLNFHEFWIWYVPFIKNSKNTRSNNTNVNI